MGEIRLIIPINLIVAYFNKMKMAHVSQLLKGENKSFMPEGVFIFNKDFHLKTFLNLIPFSFRGGGSFYVFMG